MIQLIDSHLERFEVPAFYDSHRYKKCTICLWTFQVSIAFHDYVRNERDRFSNMRKTLTCNGMNFERDGYKIVQKVFKLIGKAKRNIVFLWQFEIIIGFTYTQNHQGIFVRSSPFLCSFQADHL